MLDEALVETGVLVTLYDSPTSWPTLRTALAMAMAGNGSALLTLSDMYDERNPRPGITPTNPRPTPPSIASTTQTPSTPSSTSTPSYPPTSRPPRSWAPPSPGLT
jgi:hypothetical protein